jgi:uncharacterized protein with PIN domain
MEEIKFIVTNELGKLAKWARMLGYDTVYYKKTDPSEIIITALKDERILLTRSSSLTKHRGVNIINITHDHVEEQVNELAQSLGLTFKEEDIFQRCIECNQPLEKIEKSEAKGKVPERVYEENDEFKICEGCNKLFWKGTHWKMVKGFLQRVSSEKK